MHCCAFANSMSNLNDLPRQAVPALRREQDQSSPRQVAIRQRKVRPLPPEDLLDLADLQALPALPTHQEGQDLPALPALPAFQEGQDFQARGTSSPLENERGITTI